MHIRHILFLFAFLIVMPGCGSPSPTSTASPVLIIERGSVEDISPMGGTFDAELLRFDVTNVSDHHVRIQRLGAAIAHVDWTPVADGTATDIKFTDGYGRVLMGPQELGGRDVVGFDDEYLLRSGETETFVLRADLGPSAERMLVSIGGSDYSGTLPPPVDLHDSIIFDAVFADSGEAVALDSIVNNRELVRVVNVLPAEMAVLPPTTTALVVTFGREQGILHPEDGWIRIGTIGLDSYGGDSIFRGTGVFGGNLGLFSSITLADGSGRIIGEMTRPISACSCGSVRLLEPMTVTVGGHMDLQVFGSLSSDSDRGDITFGLDHDRIDASAVDGGDFAIIFSAADQSYFRVWNTHPIVVTQALSTSTLINDVEQDLYKIQLSSAVAGRSLHIGSLTFRINGFGASGLLTDVGLRLGSAMLSPATYRIVRTNTGETIRFPERSSTGGIVVHGDSIGNHDAGTEEITLIFTDPDGLLISDSGLVLTLVGTPSGFATGDMLETFFGDYVFSGGALSWGNMTDAGRITVTAGEEGLVDPIVWTADSGVGGVYTGAWEIRDLSRFGILTAP